MKTTTKIEVPQMNETERASFERQVLALFKARWNTGKIRSWAVANGSGFSKFWASNDHALETINVIARAHNRQIAADNRRVRADAMARFEGLR
jgi:hypothetical protein